MKSWLLLRHKTPSLHQEVPFSMQPCRLAARTEGFVHKKIQINTPFEIILIYTLASSGYT